MSDWFSKPKLERATDVGVFDELTPDNVLILAKSGMTNEQIAECFGLDESELELYLEIDDSLEQSIIQGRAQGVAEVSISLYQNALIGRKDAQTLYLKNCAGWEDGQAGRKIKRTYEPDGYEDQMEKAVEKIFDEETEETTS